jgi:hypothetical protein
MMTFDICLKGNGLSFLKALERVRQLCTREVFASDDHQRLDAPVYLIYVHAYVRSCDDS